MHVSEITAMEFKEQRISILNHDAVIFTSKNAMDHYFGMMEKLRLRIPDYTKYFCVSEAIAHYLQILLHIEKEKSLQENILWLAWFLLCKNTQSQNLFFRVQIF